MKKFIFLLVMSVFTIQSTMADIPVDDKTNVQKEEKNFDVGKEILQKTVMGAGDVAKTGYQVIVKQQVVYAVTYTMSIVFGLLCFYGFYWFYSRAHERTNLLLPAIVILIVGLISFAYGAYHINDIVVGFLNPDYAAIKDIAIFGKDFMSAKGN